MNKSHYDPFVTETPEELIGMAERDLATVKLLNAKKIHPEDFMYNVIFYHATQAVEKLLKGYIISNGKKIEKTHDLDYLHKSAVKIDASFSKIKNNCILLNDLLPNIKYSSRYIISKQDMAKIINSLNIVCDFLPLKKIRESYSNKHSYIIISEAVVGPSD